MALVSGGRRCIWRLSPGAAGWGGSTRPSGGNAALASMGFSKHFNSQMIWRHFLINRPLEMAVEGGRKGCFVFPSHSCSQRSSSSQGGKSGPRGTACQAQPHQGALAETLGPPWCGPARRIGGCSVSLGSCLWLSISPQTAFCRSGSLEGWQLASVVFPLSVTLSPPSRAWQSRGEGPWERADRTHSQRPQLRSWLTLCTHRTFWS